MSYLILCVNVGYGALLCNSKRSATVVSLSERSRHNAFNYQSHL
jgi:hypothetical protein